jgi:para-aminobenzoate synthetase component 1
MAIINELEPVGRSVYCGSVGYVDRNGLFDSNIAIRTMVFTPKHVHCWGGGGIVADSKAPEELAEIEHKIRGMLQAVEAASAKSNCNSS